MIQNSFIFDIVMMKYSLAEPFPSPGRVLPGGSASKQNLKKSGKIRN
jgi:hypothetical protein